MQSSKSCTLQPPGDQWLLQVTRDRLLRDSVAEEQGISFGTAFGSGYPGGESPVGILASSPALHVQHAFWAYVKALCILAVINMLMSQHCSSTLTHSMHTVAQGNVG